MHIHMVQNGLSLKLADDVMKALDELSAPTLVVCNSGGRASAVKCLRKALQEKMTRDEAIAYAKAEKMPFLGNAHLTDWVSATVAHQQYKDKPLLMRPLFEETSWTYSFIIADPITREAVIIDPVDLTVDRDIKVCEEMGVKLKYAINTHCHADHITGSGLLARKLSGCQSMIAAAAGAEANVKLEDGQRIYMGERFIEARATPGHTDGCMSFVSDDFSTVFTGDALLINKCGRTDFQQGSCDNMWESIHNRLYTLPLETVVYPGHDYEGRLFSTIGEQKKFNVRFAGKTKENFIEVMKNLNLPYPKKLDASLPSNKVDGLLGH